MTEPHVIAAADQEQADLQRVLRHLVASMPTFAGTEENQLGTVFLALKMTFPSYTDMALAASELVAMVVKAEAGGQS